jgi:transposase
VMGAVPRRKAPGGQRRLSAEQQSQVLGWLREGAEAHGFRGDLWTRKRVAVLIERNLGIRYHPGHVSTLLQSWKGSSQKPEQRAPTRRGGDRTVGEGALASDQKRRPLRRSAHCSSLMRAAFICCLR